MAPSPLYVERKQQQEPSVGGIAEGSRNRGSDPKGSVGIDGISHGCSSWPGGGGAAHDGRFHQPDQSPEQWYCCPVSMRVSMGVSMR